MIQKIIDVHTNRGIDPKCELIEWLRSELHIDDIKDEKERIVAEDELRVKLLSRPDWDIMFSVIAIQECADYDEERKARVEKHYLDHILDAPDSEVKRQILMYLTGSVRRPSKLDDKNRDLVNRELKAVMRRKESVGVDLKQSNK